MRARQTKRKTVSKTISTPTSARIQRQQRLYASVPSQTVSLEHRIDAGDSSPPIPVVDCQCPHCLYKMDCDQVEDGFLTRVNDFTTQCPQCKKRFETSGTIYLSGKIERFVWLCYSQTKNELSVWAKNHDLFIAYLVDKLLEERPELAWNSYRHCYNNKTCGECGQIVKVTVVDAVHQMLNKNKKIKN